MHLLRFLVLPIALMLGAITAHAGTKVIDVELGVSTLEQVRKIASAAGRVQNNGTNTWTDGPSLRVEGGDYGIEGLRSVEYIFDSSNKLTAVIMVLGKHRFGDIVDVLAGKYKMTKKVQPFVGNQYVRFSTPDGLIEVDAPHLSFEMDVSYMTTAFHKAWTEGVKARESQQRQQEKAKF